MYINKPICKFNTRAHTHSPKAARCRFPPRSRPNRPHNDAHFATGRRGGGKREGTTPRRPDHRCRCPLQRSSTTLTAVPQRSLSPPPPGRLRAVLAGGPQPLAGESSCPALSSGSYSPGVQAGSWAAPTPFSTPFPTRPGTCGRAQAAAASLPGGGGGGGQEPAGPPRLPSSRGCSAPGAGSRRGAGWREGGGGMGVLGGTEPGGEVPPAASPLLTQEQAPSLLTPPGGGRRVPRRITAQRYPPSLRHHAPPQR